MYLARYIIEIFGGGRLRTSDPGCVCTVVVGTDKPGVPSLALTQRPLLRLCS